MIPAPEQRHLPFPLTDIQQAYWLGRSGAFPLGGVGIHGYAEVDGEGLDLERLESAWARVVAHHDMLRAVVLPDGTQRILPEVPPPRLAVEDLRALPAPEREARLEAIREELSHQVFSPERWPLFELRATRLGETRTRLHVSLDGLHVDLWSVSRVLRDWVALYRNPGAAPPPLAISFRDYALALEARRGSEEVQRSLRYWRERLPGLPPAPELPAREGADGPARRRFTGRRARLPAAGWAAVKAQAAQHGLTPSSTLVAAYAEALAGWSRSPRFTLNVTVANRLPLHPQVGELVGDFTSMVMLEVDASPRAPFGERARRLQEQLWRDLDHREVSGVQLLRELARERGPSLEPPFPVVFTGALGTPGFRVLEALGTLAHAITQTPQVTLDYQAYEVEGDLLVHWDAAEDRFPPGMVDALFEAHEGWLRRLADPAAWREARPRLVPRAQREARQAFNATRAPPPARELSAWMREALGREPGRPAVLGPGLRLERGDLAARAEALARALREAGARRDAPVAVVMEKGWEQVVAVLGILHAGAAYLPIDPEVPPERLRALLDAREVPLAVTQPRVEARVAWPEGVRRLGVDAGPPPAPASGAAAGAEPLPEELAYVLYTSGSTGTPKGVMIERRSVCNRMEEVARRFGLGPGDRALALTALHHDLSVFDLFGMLGAGGQVVFPEAARARDPGHWADRMAEEGVTVWNSVPAFMEMLVEHLESTGRAAPAGLRWVLLSGDRIPVGLPDRVRQLFPQAQVVSLGGPTETTVWDISFPIGQVDPRWRRIPYGRPLANASYHVLGPALEPRPDWVPGELYLGGAGLARGYWKDPALTAERFLLHPETGERLYRSGDVGFMRPDGTIDLLGRSDRQVKLRGERVQLEEVEAALRQHPQVRAAGAAVIEEGGGGRLVAEVVLAGPEEPSPLRLAPGEALALKLERPGVRRDLDGRPSYALEAGESVGALARRSHRRFLEGPVAAERLGRLLASLCASPRAGRPLPRYRYPSAGSLYPVQLYAAVKPGRVAGLPGGTYYHHPDAHRLVLLSGGAEVEPSVHASTNRALFEGCAFSLFLACELGAVERLYGERARDFCLIEAGCMVQLLMVEAVRHGLGLCPVGGLDFDRVRPLLGLPPGHALLHSLCGGGALAGEGLEEELPAAPAPAEALRAFLAARLPRHMVPSRITAVDRLPLTANGKLDPRPRGPAAGGGEAPRPEARAGPLEAIIASAWSEVLRLEPATLAPDANPFDHGAHSLHAVRVHALLLRRLGRELEVMDLFRHPTPRALAAHLGGGGPARVTDGAVERARRRRDRAPRWARAEDGPPEGTS